MKDTDNTFKWTDELVGELTEWASSNDWTYLPSKKEWYNEEDEVNIIPINTVALIKKFQQSKVKEQSIPEKMEIQKGLQHGFYIIHWVTGGFSYASIGYTHDGTNWFAPCNWTCESNDKPMVASTDWSKVKQIELVKNYNYANPIEKLICIEQSEVASYDGVYFKTKQGARIYTQKEVDEMISKAKTDTVVEDKFDGKRKSFYEMDEVGQWDTAYKEMTKEKMDELIKKFYDQPLRFYSPPKRYSQGEVDAIREELDFAICYLKAFVDLNKGGIKADETSKDAQKIIDNYEAKHKPLTKDKEVDTGKCICKDGQPYSNLGCPIHGFTEFEKIEPTKSEAPTGKDSKEWEIVQFSQKDGSTLWVGKNIYGCWYIYDKVLRRNFDRDEKWMIENGYPIHSVKRLSDNEVFTVGDRLRGMGKDNVITGFLVGGKQNCHSGHKPTDLWIVTDAKKEYGCLIDEAELKYSPTTNNSKAVTDNSDVACLSLNDVMKFVEPACHPSEENFDEIGLRNFVNQKLKTHTP